jgi:hypothetical protein
MAWSCIGDGVWGVWEVRRWFVFDLHKVRCRFQEGGFGGAEALKLLNRPPLCQGMCWWGCGIYRVRQIVMGVEMRVVALEAIEASRRMLWPVVVRAATSIVSCVVVSGRPEAIVRVRPLFAIVVPLSLAQTRCRFRIGHVIPVCREGCASVALSGGATKEIRGDVHWRFTVKQSTE